MSFSTIFLKGKIPEEYLLGDDIVFNVSPVAVRDFKVNKDSVSFQASFSSIIYPLTIPFKGILGLYADENGEGIFFDPEEETEVEEGDNGSPPPKGKKPFLKLVE